MRRMLALPAVIAVALLAASCSSGLDSDATDTLTVQDLETGCFVTSTADAAQEYSLCFARGNGTRITSSSLAIDSTLTVRGSDGETVTVTVDESNFIVDLDGKIVDDAIEIAGFWDDGSQLLLLVEQP